MRGDVLAAGVSALPGLCLAVAADLSERSTLRSRALGIVSPPDDRHPGRRVGPRSVVVIAALLGAGLGLLAAGPIGAVLGPVVGGALPTVRDRRRRSALAQARDAQLPLAASSIASALRAGRSVLGAIDAAAAEIGPPLEATFRQTLVRVSMGTQLAASLERWAEDLGTTDAKLVAGLLRLQGRSGGELPTALDRLARTLRARKAVASEVRSLTAQARLSGTILGLLPIGFLLFLSIASRRDLTAALQTRLGQAAIVGGLLLDGVAFLWIRRLLRVDP